MTIKTAFVIFARDKARHVHNAVASALAQSHPCEVILSDQGSTDDTLAIMKGLASQYSGHHTVRVLECPDRTPKGMKGLNAHCSWIMDQTDADLVLWSAADDISHHERARCVVETYQQTDASYIGTQHFFCDPDGNPLEITLWPHEGFVNGVDQITHSVGGSVSSAWDRRFWRKFGPLDGDLLMDVAFPFFAAQDRGFYVIAKPLAKYLKHADVSNTGLEGRIRAAKEANDTAEQERLGELAHWQLAANACAMFRRFDERQLPFRSEDDARMLQHMIFGRCFALTEARSKLHSLGLSPLGLPA